MLRPNHPFLSHLRLAAILVSAAATLAFAPVCGAQNASKSDLEELAKQAAAARESILAIPEREKKWPAFFVNDSPVTAETIERISTYLGGEAAMLATRLSVATAKEIEKRKAAGQDVSAFMVSDAEMDRRLSLMKAKVVEAFPEASFEQYLVSQGQSIESFKFAMKTQAEFDSLFIPMEQAWPDVTIQAVERLRPGLDAKQKSDFVTELQRAGKDQGSAGAALPMLLLRQQIIRQLVDPLTFRDAMDGLPADTAIEVDGRPFKTAELYKKGMGIGSYPDSLRAIQLSVIREAVRQAIIAKEDSDWAKAKAEVAKRKAAGENVAEPARPIYWLKEGSDELKAAFEAEQKAYPPGPFDHRNVVRFRKFPTMQLYRVYFQMIESFRRATAADRTTETLQKHIDENSLYFSAGQADVEAILYAFNADPSVRSVEDGYSAAKLRAEKAIADLKQGAKLAADARAAAKEKGKTDEEATRAAFEAARGMTFSDILDRDSDYKDPKQQPGQPAPLVMNYRGRFGPLQRNPLSERLHENELTGLLNGYSLSEELFFHANIGEIVGPVRGAQGYYIARVLSRSPGTKTMDLNDDKQRDLASQDYVNHAFQRFANEAVSKAKIELKK